MMDNLISLDALMQFPIRLNHYDKVHGDIKYVFGVEDVLEYAQNLPAVDAVPVVHGRWMRHKPNGIIWTLKCSACGWVDNRATLNDKFNYCPNCGAKMDQLEIIHGDCGALTAEEEWKRLRPNLSIMDKEE